MTSLELLESFESVKGKYVLEAHSEEMPESNIIPFQNAKPDGNKVSGMREQTRRHVPMKKSVLIAVIVAALLMLAGFAYAVMKLQELRLGEYTYTKHIPGEPGVEGIVSTEMISMQGFVGSPEYQATKEWRDFLETYDKDGAMIGKIGNNPTGLDEKYTLYGVYTQEMCDKLEEIALKYNLNLHTELNLVDVEELDYRVGGSFMGEGLSRGWAYIYENGTFQFDGDAMVGDQSVMLQCRRAVKGTFEEVVLNIGSTEEYQEHQYETDCGEFVLLAIRSGQALIYGDFEECFILLNIVGGSDDGITMEVLERIADGIDFTVLKNVIVPDMRGDSVVEADQNSAGESIEQDTSAEAGNEQIQESNMWEPSDSMETERIQAYRAVLKDVYDSQTFPGGREMGYDGYPVSDNKFALGDIDGDGNVELILLYITTSMAGQAEIIYDYDADTGSVREQFIEFPSVTHFDNGILKADWSHNQGLGGRVWPYTLYQYDADKDSYEAIAMVDAWDKSFADKDYEGNAFPDGVDKDGDLLVYYIMDPGRYELKAPVDFDEYEKWYDSYTRDAGTVTILYMELTEENISKLK